MKGVGTAQSGQAPGYPDERLLHEVLRQFPVAGKKVGESESLRAVTLVKSLQPVTRRWIAHRFLGSAKSTRPRSLTTTKTPCWLQRFRRITTVRRAVAPV